MCAQGSARVVQDSTCSILMKLFKPNQTHKLYDISLHPDSQISRVVDTSGRQQSILAVIAPSVTARSSQSFVYQVSSVVMESASVNQEQETNEPIVPFGGDGPGPFKVSVSKEQKVKSPPF